MYWEKQHSVHQWTIRLTLELDAFRKKMPTWLKLHKSVTKLASKLKQVMQNFATDSRR